MTQRRPCVGILGGGQLAQLLAHAAYPLGIDTLCLTEHNDDPAARNSKIMLNDHSPEVLKAFADQVDVITLENENIESTLLKVLNQSKPVYPSMTAVQTAQDRLFEKTLFQQLTIPTVRFAAITHETELVSHWQAFGKRAILKTRRFGYDGKGQARITSEFDLKTAWAQFQNQHLILEAFLDFDYEVSIIGARNQAGEMAFYPLIYNVHQSGILQHSFAPFVHPALQQQAENYLTQLMQQLDYVGVLTLECFVKDGQLYANEIAPRVHNSGHLTLENTHCSQFELHLRAILNLSLPKLTMHSNALMFNVIGKHPPADCLQNLGPNWHYYDYGKTERPGRKLGHLVWLNQPRSVF